MKIYRVGGSVRDELLGLPVVDRDYVLVGATPEEMVRLGYKPVGKDFPVFLHPETHEEYALARTERKSGRGYHGFMFHAAPDVTLEADLARRDLTINAMARSADGALIDPYGGEADLRGGVLRHVSPAFAEDPLRVLRVARFAARLGFAVAPETEALMRAIAAGGELSTLPPERVWQELSRALMDDAFRALAWERTVIGPTFDDGAWLIGAQRPAPSGFFDHNWFSPGSLRLFEKASLPHLLPFWYGSSSSSFHERAPWHLRSIRERDASAFPSTWNRSILA